MADPSRCSHCGSTCDYERPGEPCWGEVEVVEEWYDPDGDDYGWLHACMGHRDTDRYVPSPSASK